MRKVVISVLIALLVCNSALFAGGQNDTKTTGTSNASLREAPKLAEKVKAGSLPPLEKRLPAAKDVMVEPMASTGAYGNRINISFKGKEDQWTVSKFMEEALFRFTNEGTVEPNVAKGYDINANATEYTIYLREGMKWSDGVDFTADDCIFFYDKMCVPKTFGKSLYDCFYSTNPVTKVRTPCTFEKVDTYTFKVKFADPSPNFLEFLAINAKWCFAPAHYYKTILPEFIGEAAAQAKAKELGYTDVGAMGQQTGYYYWNVVGRPTLRPWVATNAVDSDLLIYDRNPYYWKTDADGRQLPYVDQIHFVRYSEENQKTLRAMAGETDIAFELSYSSIVPLKQNEKQGNYRIVTWPTTKWSASPASLQLNLTAEDPKLRALFQNKDFRRALSIAADRKEIVDLVADGFAKPTQTSPVEGAQGYSKEWANKWTEYNPAEAKKLLESCGLKMGSGGFYQFADGSPLSLEILSYDIKPEVSRVAELLTEKYFKAIGIKATFSLRDRALIDELAKANKLTAVLSPVVPMETVNIALRPDTLVPVRNYAVWYGTYGDWYVSAGKSGTAPTGDLLKLVNLYREMLTATSKADINRIALQMLKLHEDNIWQIGYYSDPPILMTINNDLKNFPDNAVYCDEFRGLGIAHFQNFYFAKDKK